MPDTENTTQDTDLRTEGVTLHVTETFEEGQRLMLAPNATTINGEGVYFNNTEPIEVTVVDPRTPLGNVRVEGLNAEGNSNRQVVAPRFLSPIPPNKWDAVLAAAGPTTPHSTRPHRLAPDRAVRVRVTSRGDGVVVGTEGWLSLIDTSDLSLTYVVVYESRGGVRPAHLMHPTPPGLDPDGRYVERWVTSVEVIPEPEPEPEPEWAPGMKFVVTSTQGWHGFPVGAVVTALRSDGTRNSIGEFHATTREVSEPFADLPQSPGTTAYVHGSDPGRNVERYVEPVSQVRDIRVGDTYRIISAEGGHGFAIDTLVKVANQPDGQDPNPHSFFVTTQEPPTQANLTWRGGVSAYVRADGVNPSAAFVSEVEPTPEPERAAHYDTPEWPVLECTERDHMAAAHYHVDMPGTSVVGFSRYVHERDGFTTRQGARFSTNRDDWVRPEPEIPAEEIPPPEEVLALLLADTDQFPHQRLRIEALMGEVAQARARVDDARQERAQWLDRLIDRAHEVASDEDWCSVFDDGMEELGLPRRGEPERETVTVTASVEVSVDFDEDQFVEWFNENVSSDHDGADSQTETFTINLSLTRDFFDVDEGDCPCDDDVDLWRDYLPQWVRDNEYSWTIIETECCND